MPLTRTATLKQLQKVLHKPILMRSSDTMGGYIIYITAVREMAHNGRVVFEAWHRTETGTIFQHSSLLWADRWYLDIPEE